MFTKPLWTVLALSSALSLLPVLGAEAPRAGADADRIRQRMAQLAEEMKLSDEQRARMREIFESQIEKAREIRSDPSLSPEEKMRAFKELQDQVTPRMKEILTPEQFAQWQEEREKMFSAALAPGSGERGRAAIQEWFAGLNLTEDQKMKVGELLRAQGEKLKELRTNTSLTPEQRMQQFKAIQDAIEPKLKEILSPDQFAQWQQLREKARAAFAGAVGERMRNRMQEIFKELNLTEDQKSKLRELFAAQGEKIKEIRANTSLTPEQRMQQFRALQEQLEPELKKILTPDQFAKWQQQREKMRAEFPKAAPPP